MSSTSNSASSMRVFLSYKTNNSNFVRIVADWLEYNGVSTWFAEKDIPLDFQFNDPAINSLLLQGIESCSHSLLFTNIDYLDSDWCKMEAEAIFAPNCPFPRSNVIEVRIPDHPDLNTQFWGLDKSGIAQLLMSPRDLPDLAELKAKMKGMGWPIPNHMNMLVKMNGGARLHFRLPILGLSLDLAGWSHERESIARDREYFKKDDFFLRDINGTVQLCITSLRYPRTTEPIGLLNGDDKELRRQTIEYAKHYQRLLSNLSQQPYWKVRRCAHDYHEDISNFVREDVERLQEMQDPQPAERDVSKRAAQDCIIQAVHLVECGARFHFAMSYRFSHPLLGWTAARKYAMVGWDRITGFAYEVVLTFQVHGSSERLLALSPLCDLIVGSLRVDETAMRSFLVSDLALQRPIRQQGEGLGNDLHSVLGALTDHDVSMSPMSFDRVPRAYRWIMMRGLGRLLWGRLRAGLSNS